MLRRALLAGVLVATTGCPQRLERKTSPTITSVDLEAPFLKVHMHNGELYILSKWTIDEVKHEVTGSGELIGTDRTTIERGIVRIPFASVALYETNTVVTSPSVVGMAVITGLSLAVTAACIANPKACFGSCPTFYAVDDKGRSILQAEGFSDAIAPSLETHDIDALWLSTGRGGAVTLRMTNEAYETHVVKQVDVLAVRRPPGGRIVATDDRLWIASRVTAPTRCIASEGSCLDQVRTADAVERTSLTDANDLAARETIELGFAPLGDGRVGILIGARQSLVTTFLLYQGLAYLGSTAGAWLAALERGGPAQSGKALERLIGGIDVQIERDGGWETVGEVLETGPLATDTHLVLLPPGATGERIRLQLPKGGWRIDHAALATIAGEATPTRIAPSRIRGQISKDYGPDRPPATAFPIVTMPGDTYDLEYRLPAGDDHELFIDSRGYYLEWMRQEWVREENPLAAVRMLLDPAQALRDLAPAFKKLESKAEALFWSSRYARP